jgi:uncharacterized integral membrane protein
MTSWHEFMVTGSFGAGAHSRVEVRYLGLAGSLPLGMALLIAAVGGGVVVAIAGVARVTQLRMNARRTRRHNSGA